MRLQLEGTESTGIATDRAENDLRSVTMPDLVVIMIKNRGGDNEGIGGRRLKGDPGHDHHVFT